MKKHLGMAILFGLAVIALLYSPALAVPSLQLDIGSGVYDESTQTIVATTDPFTLYALLRPTDVNRISDTYFISAALVPKTTPPGGDIGSFSFDGTTINATSEMIYGIPPVEADDSALKDPGDLAPHGIFRTYFSEFSFTFNPSDEAKLYNTQDNPGGFQLAGPGDPVLYYRAFTVDLGTLAEEYNLHFDLYNEVVRCSGDYDISAKAPFSHDAESRRVPEPGTLLLLGTGLFGLALSRRKRREGRN